MKYHYVIKHIAKDNQESYLLNKIENLHCCFIQSNNSIHASFNRYDAEKFLTKTLFPDFNKNPANKGQCPLNIKNLEFNHLIQFDTETTQVYEVISFLKFDLEGKFEWVILDSRIEIDNTMQQYKQFLEEKEPGIESPTDHTVVNFINTLADAQRQNNLVLLIGAGFSINYGYPSWNNLMHIISQKYGIQTMDDILKFAQIFYNKFPDEYYPFLKSIFLSSPNIPEFDFLKEIFTINPNCIITTNYDNLLENTKYSFEYQVVSSSDDFVEIKSDKLILKMHGDFKNNNIVFTENDYLSYERTHKLLKTHVSALFASKTILLIGFSYNDINLKKLLAEIKAESKKDFNKWFIYFPNNNLSPDDLDYFKSNNLEVLNYCSDISYYLGNSIKKLERDSDSFRFFAFLRILNIALKDELTIASKDPIEQAYDLFEKYNHILTISPYQLRKIKPFNETGDLKNAKFIPSHGILQMKENQFWRRFNQIEFDYDDLSKSKDLYSNQLSEDEINWWKKIFENNWYSFIWMYGIHNTPIQKSSHSKDGAVREISERKDEGKIKESLYQCNLLAMSNKINSDQIFEFNDAMYHLLYFGKRVYAAMIGAKLLNHYIDLKDFYNSLRIIKILSDFKYQIKDDFESDIPQTKRDELYEFISEFDLYEKFVDYKLTPFERSNFLDVFGDEIPNRLYKESYEAYLSLEDNYTKYKIAGYESWGNDFKNDIYYTFGFLFNQAFFNYNPIFWYNNRKDFVNIFIYSNLISININENYHGHNNDGLDNFFLSVYLQLFLPKDFKSFHDRFPEIKFKFNESAKEYLKTYLNNLLASIISQDMEGKSIQDNFMKEEMNKSYFLAQDINYQLNKILTILCYSKDIEFRDNLVKDNIENFQFLIKERVVYDDYVLVEFAKILIDIDLVLYEKYLLNLREIKIGKDLSLEIFFINLYDTYEKFGNNKLEDKFNFIIDNFDDLHHDYQIKYFRFLSTKNHQSKINEIRDKIQPEKIKNGLLKAYLDYLSTTEIENILKYLEGEIGDSDIQTYTDESVFYINNDQTARSLYLVFNDNNLKKKLNGKKLGKYYEFAIFPNEFDYKHVNPKWLLTGHSNHNINFLSKATLIIWLQKLNELKVKFPEILIDHMYKKVGEALGKLDN